MSFWTDRLAGCAKGLALVLVCLGWFGCAGGGAGTSSATNAAGKPQAAFVDVLRKGDLLTIVFAGPNPPTDKEERIKEDGTVNLPLIGSIQAEGKSSGQLQKEIQDLYVPTYYKRLTVTVKTENRVFYVQGEVRAGGRLVYTGEITVMGAIASAGGFTDFAARNRIEVVKVDGSRLIVDGRKAKNNRKFDPPVVPGDQLYVPRRGLWGGR